MNAKTGIGAIAIAVLVAAVILVVKQGEKQRRAEINQLLVEGANAVDRILPADYQERIEDESSISEQEYEKYRDLLNAYSWEQGLTYISSYMKFGDKIYTCASSFTKGDMESGDDHGFFYHYEEPSYALVDAFDGDVGVPVFEYFSDPEYGEWFAVYIPRKTESGQVYVVSADFMPAVHVEKSP